MERLTDKYFKTMKKLLILLLVFLPFQSNAQWYTRQFDVTDINDLNKEQLNIAFTQSQKIVITGAALTIIGVAEIIVGGVIYHNGKEEYVPHFLDFGLNDKMVWGGILIGSGALSTSVGIPIWIVGGNRKYIIKGQLTKFNDTSYIPSIGIKITF
jgi:hypothetical protein